jgi:hypothetical protein
MSFKTKQHISNFTVAVNLFRLYRVSFFDDLETVKEIKEYDQYQVTLTELIADINKYFNRHLMTDQLAITTDDITIGQYVVNDRLSRDERFAHVKVLNEDEKIVFFIDINYDESDSFFVTYERVKI